MDEATRYPVMTKNSDDLEKPIPENEPEKLRERAIRYVKELGYFVRLFVSLLLDDRVDRKIKLFVASVLAYVVSPVDFIPELFSGLFGMLDDFVLSAFALNVILNWVDPEIIKSHWKGNSDLLVTVQKAIKNAEILVPDGILKKIESWIGRHSAKVMVAPEKSPAKNDAKSDT